MVGAHLVLDLEKALRTAPNRRLGLWGMPGLGKSTLARALCASLQLEFLGRTCLLEFPATESLTSDPDQAELQERLADSALRQLGIRTRAPAPRQRVSFHVLLCLMPKQSTICIQHLLCFRCYYCRGLFAVQAVQQALLAAPTLLVLDNVTGGTAAAARRFLGPAHPDSLLLVTTWSALIVQSINDRVTGQQRLAPLPAAAALSLQHAEAAQLIKQQMQQCQTVDRRPATSDEQLGACADRAAAALAFSSAPFFVPSVLITSAWALSCMAEQPDILDQLLQQLQAGQEPATHFMQMPAPEIFAQLRDCYDQLQYESQIAFLDLSRVSSRRSWTDRGELALWVSCRQPGHTSAWTAEQRVRHLCKSQHMFLCCN